MQSEGRRLAAKVAAMLITSPHIISRRARHTNPLFSIYEQSFITLGGGLL